MITDDGMRMTNRTGKIRFPIGWVISSLMAVVLFSGCAEKGPVLLNVVYQPAGGKAVASTKVVVGLSPFMDNRQTYPSLLGTRTVPSGMQDDYVVKGTVAGLVTSALRDALKAHGLDVKDVPSWDLSAEGMKAEGAALLFGGEIKTMRLDSKGATFQTSLTASVEIKIVVGDIAEKKIIRKLDVHSKIEQETLYSREKLESALSEALTSALDQIFQDDVLIKRLQPQ